MEHSNIELAGILQVLNLGQKVTDRLIQPQIALFNGNAGQGSHNALGGGFQIMRLRAVPFAEIPFKNHVIVTHDNDTVDAFHVADVANSCFKLDRVKTQERR